jgi:hypothetical protein
MLPLGGLSVFPTTRRDKLPPYLSYPVGAAAISETLADVPQAAVLSLYFVVNRSLQHRVARAQPILVLRIDYSHLPIGIGSSRWVESAGGYAPRWGITTYAVPREQKAIITTRLAEDGFSRCHEWLVTNESPPSFVRKHSLDVHFDENTHTLLVTDHREPGHR